ncbi:unnamed protein product [Cylindrotheca closterium]|uniref:DUF6824 domain-containing protein n=1 Tax=Cylindrotheca closterium TaxID=2856 RepID=A0AAD2JL49_9STRA|nr:unnamed protein product [Cylindrotheca closterium]
MVSNSDQDYRRRLTCSGICGRSEDYEYDFLSRQNTQSNGTLTREDEEKKQEMETLVSEAMNQLSFDERQRQQEALHGVEEGIIEDEALISSALEELDSHLLRRSNTDRSAYEKAERMDPHYVGATALRLMFLRCNRYDAKASAGQMLKFFEMKQQLFGDEKLVKEITMEDLDADDLACLNCGFLRMIGKDQSSRHVFLGIPALRSFKALKNEMKSHFFFKMSLLKYEEIQLRGVVRISYEVGHCRNKTSFGMLEFARLSNAIPLRMASIHLCIDDIKAFFVYDLALKALRPTQRAKLKIHYGTHLECQYRLSSYGISRSLLPFDPSTNVITQKHLIHLSPTNPISSVLSTTVTVFEPSQPFALGNTDNVLFSRGRTGRNRGNLRLRTLVTESSRRYDSGSNESKRVVVDDIISKIHGTGGRFLKQQSTTKLHTASSWVQLPVEEVRTKITQMFRNKKRAALRQNANDGFSISGDPLPSDVVFGKFHNSRGKDLMQRLIKDRFEEYDSLDRGKKTTVVDAIIEAVKAKGGRFLLVAPSNDGYLEVSTETVRERVAKYFRNQRRTSTTR